MVLSGQFLNAGNFSVESSIRDVSVIPYKFGKIVTVYDEFDNIAFLMLVFAVCVSVIFYIAHDGSKGFSCIQCNTKSVANVAVVCTKGNHVVIVVPAETDVIGPCGLLEHILFG